MQRDRFPASEPSEYDEAARAEEMRRLQVERALEYREIVSGMNMDDVRSVWGSPGDVEVAGDPALGNQRWIYHDGLSGPWSARNASPSRIVYFESGRVAGWKRD